MKRREMYPPHLYGLTRPAGSCRWLDCAVLLFFLVATRYGPLIPFVFSVILIIR